MLANSPKLDILHKPASYPKAYQIQTYQINSHTLFKADFPKGWLVFFPELACNLLAKQLFVCLGFCFLFLNTDVMLLASLVSFSCTANSISYISRQTWLSLSCTVVNILHFKAKAGPISELQDS